MILRIEALQVVLRMGFIVSHHLSLYYFQPKLLNFKNVFAQSILMNNYKYKKFTWFQILKVNTSFDA